MVIGSPQLSEGKFRDKGGTLQTCAPVNNLFFLKTHKCASSSLQNIFLRYGKNHNLTFALPKKTNYFGERPKLFNHKFIMFQPSGMYNLLCHHTRWNAAELDKVMPHALRVSIVRHPAAVLESLYAYSNFKKRYKVDFATFISDPEHYDHMLERAIPPSRNSMLFDFGLDFDDFDDEDKTKQKIDEIQREFQLVMISERFDESLVLLRELLCWSWDDMLVFHQNKRIHTLPISDYQRQLVTNWSWADTRLYNLFQKIFDEKVHKYGKSRMRRHAALLNRNRQKMFNFCVDKEVNKSENIEHDLLHWSPDVYNFRLKRQNSLCYDLTTPDLQFTDHLRQKLKESY